ncbi:MAG: cytochrome c [Gammaproteobacteria bacterium]|nr:cytochrome c [Gammaproteobacteria bacterium]
MLRLSGVVVFLCCSYIPLAAISAISVERQAELHNLLTQDCGSCHGMTLKGGLGPALTVEAINKKPRDLILETVLNGRPGTPMPPWKNILSREEIEWLVDRLYQGID